MSDDADRDVLRALAVYGESIHRNVEETVATAAKADAAIGEAQSLLLRLGKTVLERKKSERAPLSTEPPCLRAWEEIVAESRAKRPDEVSFANILSAEEMAAATGRLSRWKSEFGGLDQLTGYDYAVAGVAGVFAGIADIFLVQVPRHPGFLGGEAAEGGWLSNVIKDRFGDLLPENTIRALEANFKVPFDPSTNQRLEVPVKGLGARTHRMASLGHDPILGWYFGLRDILAGGFTAIGSDGRLVIQPIPGWEPEEFGVGLFVKILEALQTVAGHMLSDVATPAGLPPPLFGLLQFFQNGGIGDHSVADVARAMYRSGYDFRHCLAGGITVAIVEVFVRTAWTVRELSEGKALIDALPVANQRLQSGLFLSHSVATAVNAGKVAVTQNPLSVNSAQWHVLFLYALPQLHWLLVGRENSQAAFIRKKLDASWTQLDEELASVWVETFGTTFQVVL